MKTTCAAVKKAFETAGLNIDINALSDSASFSEQGIDSLDVSSLLLSIEEGFGVTIPDEKMDELNTIEKIAEYIDEQK
ncbi:phosphopantetheine-binding protein [Ectopseudomonas mendocina]|jgi:acyl carrier protein|uniref:phosphopantetheine-binding protein n=1 Tax=Ectopseudomonas mendocina TaxID=300 RepID=UPI003133212C